MAKAVFLRTFCKNLAAFLSARVERYFEFFFEVLSVSGTVMWQVISINPWMTLWVRGHLMSQ